MFTEIGSIRKAKFLAREAGVSVKPGAQAPGRRLLVHESPRQRAKAVQNRHLSPVITGSQSFRATTLGLAPQALRLRPLRGLNTSIIRFVVFLSFASSIAAQAPEILKVDPPSWFRTHSINPVRVLVRGRNLSGARVTSSNLRIGPASINSSGTYLFVDVQIPSLTKPGSYRLKITTSRGATDAAFEVLNPLPTAGRFQGFSPDDVVYLIMIDRFSDGDQSNNDPPQSQGLYDRSNKFYYHGGDLQGVIDRLLYLKDLGVTAVWLTPWYDNYDRLNEIELKEGKPCTGFHGYNPQDFYGVEEHFGTLAKLQELVNKTHSLGLKIIQDQVVNHTGPYHPWVDDSPTPTWFNGTRQKHLANVFETWTLHDPRPVEVLRKKTMEGWFLNFLPDLNQNDGEVTRYLIQNTLWWIGVTGIDGIRMDTWQYVPNVFWNRWTRAIKREYPRFTVVGEVKDGDVVHTAFFQGGVARAGADSRLDSLLDFPLFYPIRHAFAEGKNLDVIPKTLSRDYLYTNPEILMTLLGGHDDGRFMSEHGATLEGLKLANAFVLTTRGVPQLYYGDEIEMTGGDEPTARRDFPGGFPGDKRNAFTKEGRSKDEQQAFEFIRTMAHLHQRLEPLKRGKLINLHVSEQQYVFARKSPTGVVLVAMNNDTKPATMNFDVSPVGLSAESILIDRIGVSSNVEVRNGMMTLSLPSRAVAVLVKE
ncbi:MAG TPA: alpha-amylase family glycosyl hydrolase [Pyrinomonadaceae bacterium]|jgi:glycosidase|nr:alpha-amylase family glycosyl hydrolase [Pyrinomonadaceae bacterium]